MVARIEAQVKGELLRWARETAGLSAERAAKKLKVGEDRLAAWENDRAKPSVPQLRKLANVYKRPLAAFFLPRTPAVPTPPHDFRRLPGEREQAALSPELTLELRRARFRRRVALELIEDAGGNPRPTLTSAKTTDNPDTVAASARARLGVTVAEQESWSGDYAALAAWIAAVERLGVLVFQTGSVPLGEMRGFSVSEDVVPVVVLNAKDRPHGRIFTLLHEFAHLLLHNGGVCDPTRVSRDARSADERIEAFCNRVAGAVLIPEAVLLADPRVASTRPQSEWDDAEVKLIADRFNVSRDVVLRRLLITGRITAAYYDAQYRRLRDIYEKMSKRDPGKSIPYPPYRKALRNNGLRYTRLVLDAFEQGGIGPSTLVQYLGTKFTHFERISELARTHSSAETT